MRATLRATSLPNLFWAEVAKIFCYAVNQSLSISIELKTPMKIWTGKLADYSYLTCIWIFNVCDVQYLKKNKDESKSKKYIFLGYADTVKGYHL